MIQPWACVMSSMMACLLPVSVACAGEIPSVTVGAGAPQTIDVPRWQPCDFAFSSTVKPENPFKIPFSATVKGPGGAAFRTAGFYDGDGTWKIRISPTAEGAWSVVTQSEAPDLNGKTVAFTCTPNKNPRVHGGLRVDTQHPRHFVFEDGTRCFLMGYECDWMWALENPEPFLDKLAAYGFNYIILNAYAHDTSWRKGKTATDDYGPPTQFAWAGTNEQPDHHRFNLTYWRHYDRIITALHQRGLVAHVMIKVYNKKVNWPDKNSAEEDLYFRWLLARYAAYPNVHWDFSKESHNEKDLDYKLARMKFIRDHDPYHRPLTTHTDLKAYDSGVYNTALDYRSDQVHKNWHASLLDHRRQHDWPVVNVEFGYEHGPDGPNDATYRVVQPPEEVCRRAWEICLAGGYGAYYYTYTAWDVIRPQDTPPGYAYFKNLRQFFDATGYWLMEPADELTSAGYCLANPGTEYILFLNKAQSFTLKLAGITTPLPAEWYQPFTGQRHNGGSLANGTVELTPPAAWGDGPVALHIGALPLKR